MYKRQVVKDAKEIMCEYDSRMCKKVILALLTELEERSWGNGGDNVRAYKVSKESELTMEEQLPVHGRRADYESQLRRGIKEPSR